MTKVRPPVSIENTLHLVIGQIGIEGATAATSRSVGYLNACTDPDNRQELTVRDMIALDLACRAAGDPTYPLYATIGLLLDATGATRFADAAQLGRLAGEASREGGEACAALIETALAAGANPRQLGETLRHLEEVHGVFTDAIASVRTMIAGGGEAVADPP